MDVAEVKRVATFVAGLKYSLQKLRGFGNSPFFCLYSQFQCPEPSKKNIPIPLARRIQERDMFHAVITSLSTVLIRLTVNTRILNTDHATLMKKCLH